MTMFPTAPGYPGAETSPIGPRTATPTTLSTSVTLPVGWFMIVTGAHNTVQLTYASASTDTLIAASSAGTVFSDGANLAIVNDSTGGTAAHYYLLSGNSP